MGEFTKYFNIEAVTTKLVDFAPNLLAAILLLVGVYIFLRLSSRTLRLILDRAGFHPTLIRFIVDNIYRYVVLGIGVVMAADQLGFNMAAALAGLGVAGVAIGFAAQDSLANMIAGFLIFWDKPFEVDDWVTVSGQYGKVTEITLRSTRIRTNNNTYVVIPNKNIIDEVLVNHSKHGETRIDVPVGIAYKENIVEARRVILKAIENVPQIAKDPHPDVVVNGLGASSVDLFVRVWIDNAVQERPVFYAVMEASKLALDEAGIEIPYHHMQLFVEDVQDRVWEKMARLPALKAVGQPGAGSGE